MTRPFDKHLDSDELDKLVSPQGTSASGLEQLSQQDLGEAQRHVESCQDCSRKVQVHKSLQGEILRMRAPNPSPPTPECIADAEWLEVAAGLYPDAKTIELMKHAAQCGHCGPLLKNIAEILADETTPREEMLLTSLSSARPEWKKNMAATLRSSVGTQGSDREKRDGAQWWQALFSWPRTAFALAGVAVAVMAGWLGLSMLRPPSAEQLLAQAYTEHRTLDVRIPGAKYAPMRVERSGSGSSNLDKSPSLLKAEALIGENLGKNPSDPIWLQARARADLLDGNYESAIKALQRAQEMQADSTALLTDLASAYYIRGTRNPDRQVDIGFAIDCYSRVLAKNPNDLIALFNRALSEDGLYLYAPEIADWQRYLQVAPHDSWSDEARRNLDAAQEKVRRKQTNLSAPLLDADQVASTSSSSDQQIDIKLDDYQYTALTEWLPRAFSTPARDQFSSTKVALATVARVARERHGDMWLSDLLASTPSSTFHSALIALAAAVAADRNGDPVAALNSALKASDLFLAGGTLAGWLRAEEEAIYAYHLLYDGPRCLSKLRGVMPSVQDHPYYWLLARLELEASVCYGLTGKLGAQKEALERETRVAREHGYIPLFLSGLGFQSDSAAARGDSRTGFSLACAGLEIFWSTSTRVMPGYNFYTDLDTAADALRLPFLQIVLWHQATELIDADPDIVLRAMAHRWYADAAYLANQTELALREYGIASSLFRSAPATEATVRDQMDADIWLASLETRSGDFDQASALLQQIQGRLRPIHSFQLEINYYTAKANLGLHMNDAAATDDALRSAIALAEWGLASFTSEGDRRQWWRESGPAYRNLVSWKLRQGDYRVALEFWEWYKGAELRSASGPVLNSSLDRKLVPDFHNPPPLATPAALAQNLPSLHDKVVIAYADIPDGIGVWTYDDRGVFFHWIATPASSIEMQIENFKRLCSASDSDLSALRSTARALYDALIAPIEDRLDPARTLVFEPDGPLSSVPFEALLDSHGRYLIARSRVEIAPGLYPSLRLRRVTPITAESPTLVVSVPTVADPGTQSAPEAQVEAEAVASSFKSARELSGASATLSAIGLALRESQVFHFAGHAVALPERSGLLLNEMDPLSGRPRLVGANSFSRALLGNLQLVVLSACSTGVDLYPTASGTESLTQALFHAGVPNVISSRWNVDSAVTANLMKAFYAHLLNGDNARDSLRASELALATQPVSAHPYYWAAFALHGMN